MDSVSLDHCTVFARYTPVSAIAAVSCINILLSFHFNVLNYYSRPAVISWFWYHQLQSYLHPNGGWWPSLLLQAFHNLTQENSATSRFFWPRCLSAFHCFSWVFPLDASTNPITKRCRKEAFSIRVQEYIKMVSFARNNSSFSMDRGYLWTVSHFSCKQIILSDTFNVKRDLPL